MRFASRSALCSLSLLLACLGSSASAQSDAYVLSTADRLMIVDGTVHYSRDASLIPPFQSLRWSTVPTEHELKTLHQDTQDHEIQASAICSMSRAGVLVRCKIDEFAPNYPENRKTVRTLLSKLQVEGPDAVRQRGNVRFLAVHIRLRNDRGISREIACIIRFCNPIPPPPPPPPPPPWRTPQ